MPETRARANAIDEAQRRPWPHLPHAPWCCWMAGRFHYYYWGHIPLQISPTPALSTPSLFINLHYNACRFRGCCWGRGSTAFRQLVRSKNYINLNRKMHRDPQLHKIHFIMRAPFARAQMASTNGTRRCWRGA